jgi:hypothetical protein
MANSSHAHPSARSAHSGKYRKSTYENPKANLWGKLFFQWNPGVRRGHRHFRLSPTPVSFANRVGISHILSRVEV